jgi:large subunit ribosomal protein L30
MSARLRVTLRRSTVGTNPSARGTIRALGLHHIGQTVEVADGPEARGQVRAVRYLVDVEEVTTEAKGKARAATSKKEEGAS